MRQRWCFNTCAEFVCPLDVGVQKDEVDFMCHPIFLQSIFSLKYYENKKRWRKEESRAAYITMGQMRSENIEEGIFYEKEKNIEEGNTLGALAAKNIVYMKLLRVCFYFVGSFREPTLHL